MTYATDLTHTKPDTTARVLRAASGIGLATVALTGVWSHPWAVFTLCTLSIYLTASALVGRGLFDGLFTGKTDDSANVTASERAGRGVTAGVTLGTVISGALMLDPIDMFVLLLVGMYAGMSALMGWDPVRAMFSRRQSAGHGLTHPIPVTVGQTGLGGTRRMDGHRAA